MAEEMLWVAMRDKKGWSSNRTRDNMDVAFTVYRKTSSESLVEVRIPHKDDPNARARRVRGRFYFTNSVEAKTIIERTIKLGRSMEFSDINEGRTWLLDELDKNSIHPSATMATPTMEAEPVVEVVTTPVEAAEDVINAELESMVELMSTLKSKFDTVSSVPIESTEVQKPEVVVDISMLKPGDPAPAGYMWIGKELVKLAWPS